MIGVVGGLLIERSNPVACGGFSKTVVTDVGGNAVQPGGEPGGILERGQLLMSPDL
jgi:hypothetical protein